MPTSRLARLTALALLLLSPLTAGPAPAQLVLAPAASDGQPAGVTAAKPLDRLAVTTTGPGTVEVRDGAGARYFMAPAGGTTSFRVGGALGIQRVVVRDPAGAPRAAAEFTVDAATAVADGGKYHDMFALFRQGMNSDHPTGVATVEWNGRPFRIFVIWVLDNYHTGKGMKYFSPDMTGLVDIMRQTQREDGMIWSNMNLNEAVYYYQTAYGPFGYVRKYGDRYFVRQPAENHPEYCYVSTIYQDWKATGDDRWMAQALPSARRALEYPVTDPARWSARFRLLKRVYTIDSWDFQVDDAYTPDIGLTNTMLIDPVRSKFGVFFGDNVSYAAACEELAEMLRHTGDAAGAVRYLRRAAEIRGRLDALSWNGRFFTHFIDEDPAVHRDLGVDERTQIAQGNAYALNRGVSAAQADAIIRTYEDLRAHLPPGSPGEWYAIYPPFPRGFGRHDGLWQYMNGGVGGHVAGELARGALEHGHEAYGRDILDRLTALGHAHGDKIWFAYTGAVPPPPPAPRFTPLDLTAAADMDLTVQGGPAAAPWMQSAKPGDDLRGLPAGDQTFAGIAFRVIDPAANGRRAVVAVSHRAGLPPEAAVPVHARAGSLYLLHTATKPGSEGVCGSVTLEYADGSHRTQYLMMGRQLTYWWFPELTTPTSGVAWHGPSPASADVGVSWCALDNPEPDQEIAQVRFRAPDDDGIYTVLAATLADRPRYIPPNPVSFGGPDPWAAATAMAALLEGLAGVTDGPDSGTFSHPVVAPRWDPAGARDLAVCVRYPASPGYVAYRWACAPAAHRMVLVVTGSGIAMQGHFLLPEGVGAARSVAVDGTAVPFTGSTVGASAYVDLVFDPRAPREVEIRY